MSESGFVSVDRTDNPAEYVRRLDETAARDFWQQVEHRMATALDLRLGDRVLDVGCGTGADVLNMAVKVGVTGRAVGVDVSETMVQEAQKRAEGTGLPVDVYRGDAHCLEFPDGSFDACRAERVFQHLDDPDRAFGEMVRVARPGGRIVVVEPDYGTLTIRGADLAVTHRILNCRRKHFRSPTIGRRLPGLIRDLKLHDPAAILLPLVGTDITAKGEMDRLHMYLAAARAAGAVSEEEGAEWIDSLQEAGRVGAYAHAVTTFLVSGRKP